MKSPFAKLHLDWFLLLPILALFAVGLVALYSAGGEARFAAQWQRGAVGLALMVAVSCLPFSALRHGGAALFVFVLAALVAVLVVGVKINNARRWLDVGFYIQPSELMKVFLPIGLAYAYSLIKSPRWWHHIALIIALIGAPVLLVLQQPDFGTSALIALSGLVVVFVAGIGWKWIGGFAMLGVAMLPIAWSFILKPYQRERVLTMLDPYQDPLGAGYHTIQSQIAVGSGGVWGKGFLAGTQAQLGFLPERHTDFIFAVFAEEFGLVGALVLLGLATLILWRCLYIGGRADNRFACLAVTGIAAAFFFTFVINLMMVSGLLPVVGMPLPLVSYGGTAQVAVFVGFGFIMAISRINEKRIW